MKRIAHLCRNQWDRTVAAVLVVAGFVAIIAAWAQTRQSVFAFEQVPLLISGGILGMSLIAVGVGSWVSADLRDTWRKLDDLDATIGRAGLAPVDEPAPLDVRDRVPAGEARLS